MGALAVIWVGIGFILWTVHAVRGRDANDVHAPPQRTLVGAMMWPFYLIAFLFHKVLVIAGLRPKTDDE